MTEITYLNNQFLIAMPALFDPNFFHTVTYICQHNDDGALGIVINRPTDMKLKDIFEQMDITCDAERIRNAPVFAGGPVQQERGFVIHSPCERQWDSSVSIADNIVLTSSRDILEAIAHSEGPENFLVALGYAGWGSGQLEKEIIENSWLNTPCGEAILFKTPVGQRWSAAANQVGIDINRLTTVAGHG
ncbi:MAG: YqgE/AlgH family protein [Methylomonas sp.]|nr:YqgE/AlgH family protein [Methylomonas sp.]PPD21925.1 MAG: YqgE/AlgH family protein [Methylomonas sp.]PPD26067.1 MAG: YqgE/AlgH family protein [Methylomonas sp.]PPD37785.1 MAG: YqgE/AlgH family protein [Methylomonas sp.]PPD40623.1 MAG: YqgE/AlgH family protein [Methylomonas sp.]